MVVGLGVAGVNEGHVIHVRGDVGEDLGGVGAGLAELLKFEGGLHERADLIGEEAGFLIEASELLTIVFFEGGLVVPGIDLGLAAVHEEPDDGFGFGGEVGGLGGEGIKDLGFRSWDCGLRIGGWIGGEEALGLEEIGEGEKAQATAGLAEEGAAVWKWLLDRG